MGRPSADRAACAFRRAWTIAALMLATSSPERAAAARKDLRTLDAETVRGLAPLLETGELLLIESRADGRLEQGTLLKLADAPAARVLDVVARMEDYPRFIPNLVRSEVLQRQGPLFDLAWELEAPFVNLSGVNRVVDDRPRSVRYRPVEGSIRSASFLWQATDVPGGTRSVAAHYLSADVSEASWFLKKLIEARPSVEPGAVVSTGLVLIKAICEEAARREGKAVPSRPSLREEFEPRIETVQRQLADPGVRRALMHLLGRGVVAMIQSHRSGRLRQAVVLELIDRPPDVVEGVVTDVERLPEFVPNVKEVAVTDRSSDRIAYLLRVSMPLIDLSVHTELRVLGGPARRLALRVIGGDIKQGRYAWEFLPIDGGARTLAAYYINTDIRQQSWFLEKLVEREPYYEHGLNVGLGFVTVRAVGDRAEAVAR